MEIIQRIEEKRMGFQRVKCACSKCQIQKYVGGSRQKNMPSPIKKRRNSDDLS
jgi:hypothetical protein